MKQESSDEPSRLPKPRSSRLEQTCILRSSAPYRLSRSPERSCDESTGRGVLLPAHKHKASSGGEKVRRVPHVRREPVDAGAAQICGGLPHPGKSRGRSPTESTSQTQAAISFAGARDPLR